GMQPLVPYLSGQPHPLGKRLVNIQKCLRTVDFENIGDNTHHTFFQMLGNWSLGDYFKKDAINWSFEFLTGKKWLNIPLKMLAFTVYEGDKTVPRDTESYELWKSLSVPAERIAFLGKDNFWIAGDSGPCGPSTEMFYWTGEGEAPKKFDAKDERWVEIWNDVFMQLNKGKDGSIKPLKQKNVDTGMGFERTLAVLSGKKSAYETDLFQPVIKKIEQLSGKKYKDAQREMRIIADHVRAATFILGDDNAVTPSNVDRGYVLRRLIRRAVRYARLLEMEESLKVLAELVVKDYGDYYTELRQNKERVFAELQKEEQKFAQTLEKGLREFEKMAGQGNISGKDAFLLFQSYGFPLEMTEELADEKKVKVDVEGFLAEFQKHQELSRKGAEKKFKGGLADISAETVRLHTATHLLNEALRKVIDPKIKQCGSNITPERLRFDFSFDRKLTPEEVKKVEDEVNRVIKKQLPVVCKEMTKDQAVKIGAEMEFGQKYPDKVTVYFVGDYSKEFCGGPHVKNTKEVGKFKIVKEEACSAGVRRIKAVVV
ncbi:MAG TPA: alanine--tRNA ligase, partial [Candidatus Nanoarchaeia archaeon]|nr:alanine--tRNA ligase [Candidatus Nanoarchaeia archaeon]